MATIRKRGSRWQVQVRKQGFPPITKSFHRRTDAEAWGRLKEVEAETGQLPMLHRQAGAKLTVSELLTRYDDEVTCHKRGAKSESARIRVIKRQQIAAVSIDDLTASHVAAYRDVRLKEVSGPSVRREMTILRHCLEIARKEWRVGLHGNPAAEVSRPADSKPRTRRLTSTDLKELDLALSQCRNPLVKPVFLFALATGMRRSEVLSLTWENVRWKDKTAFLPTTKNGDSREVPLSPPALSILKERRKGKPITGVVFPISANALRLAWERTKRRAKVTDLRFHDLRHEAISRYFELGLSVPEVSLISGHKDSRMLFRYTHLKATDVANRLARSQTEPQVKT
jgi:integrase